MTAYGCCRRAGYSREVLFLTDGGVSGNEEERILSLVGGGGSSKPKVSSVPRGRQLLMRPFEASPRLHSACRPLQTHDVPVVKTHFGTLTCRSQRQTIDEGVGRC